MDDAGVDTRTAGDLISETLRPSAANSWRAKRNSRSLP